MVVLVSRHIFHELVTILAARDSPAASGSQHPDATLRAFGGWLAMREENLRCRLPALVFEIGHEPGHFVLWQLRGVCGKQYGLHNLF